MSSAVVAEGAAAVPGDAQQRGGDERRAKALEEHRRLMKEHCDKDNKLRECTVRGLCMLVTNGCSAAVDSKL